MDLSTMHIQGSSAITVEMTRWRGWTMESHVDGIPKNCHGAMSPQTNTNTLPTLFLNSP